MSAYTPPQIASMAGISGRHLRRLLDAGKGPPGASQKPSGRWEIPNSVEARAWCREFRRWSGVKVPATRKKALRLRPPVDSAKVSAESVVAALRAAQDVAQRAFEEMHGQALRVGAILLATPAKGPQWSALLAGLGLSRTEAAALKKMVRRKNPVGRLSHLDARILGAFAGIGEIRAKVGEERRPGRLRLSYAGKLGAAAGAVREFMEARPVEEWTADEIDNFMMSAGPLVDMVGTVRASKGRQRRHGFP
jgi:hypothetical protein